MTKDALLVREKIGTALREMIEDARKEYQFAPDRSAELTALARLARLRASLAGLEAE